MNPIASTVAKLQTVSTRAGLPDAGIRSYLYALVLAVLIPLLALAAILSYNYATAQRQVVEAQQNDAVNNLSYLIDREIERVSGTLQVLAVAPDLVQGRLDQFRLHLQAASPTMGRLTLTDRSVALKGPEGPPADEWRLNSVFNGKSSVSGYRQIAQRSPSFLVTVPVVTGSTISYALSAEIDLSRLQSLFAEAQLKPEWIGAIVDRTGVLLARNVNFDRFVGKPVVPQAVAVAAGDVKNGVLQTVSLEGMATSTSFHRSEITGWTVFVAVPTAVLLAPLNRASNIVIAISLALTALSLSLAYLLGDRVTRAVQSLQTAALDVVEGRGVSVAQYPITEFGSVSKVFEYAATIAGERQIDERKLKESEERQRMAIDAGSFGTWDLDVMSGKAVWSKALFEILGYEPAESSEATLAMWRDCVHPDDLVRTLREDEAARVNRSSYVSEYRIVRADTRAVRWLRANGQYYFDATGNPVRLVGVLRDVTERKLIELSLRESEAQYRSALTVGRLGSWETNFMTGVRTWSSEAMALFGISPKDGIGKVGGPNDEFHLALHPDDKHLYQALHDLAQTSDTFPAEYRIVRPDGSVLWLAGRGQVFERTSDGRCHRLLSVMADVTEQKKTELHIRFLLREMSHRSKNLLAVVQSIATQTMRTSANMSIFGNRFEQRLQGLAASHDILVDQNWEGATLSALVERQLAPFADPGSERVIISGPKVDLNSTAAQAVGLALHELATNAVKYGALSVPSGSIAVTWSFDSSKPPSLILDWLEKDGPSVAKPERKGFGNAVIERMAPSSVSGSVTLDYAPTGLRWTLTIPASELIV